jgi:hypothetical protein
VEQAHRLNLANLAGTKITYGGDNPGQQTFDAVVGKVATVTFELSAPTPIEEK